MKYYVLLIICMILSGCSDKKHRDDFIGIWRADNGSEIILYKDSTCVLKELDLRVVNPRIYDEVLNVKGTWMFKKTDELGYKVDNIFISSKDLTFTITFDIWGHGILENKRPWYLFLYIGAPDAMDKFKFTKVSDECGSVSD